MDFFVQVVCKDDLSFVHVFAGSPGSVHDSRVFRYSGVQTRCNGDDFHGAHHHILVDSAYTLQRHVLRPFRNNGHLTPIQRNHNRTLSHARAIVERAIGLLKIRWRILYGIFPIKRLDLMPYVIMACAILHNLCLIPDEFLQLNVIPPAAPVYEGHQQPTAQQRRQGFAKRNDIAANLPDFVEPQY